MGWRCSNCDDQHADWKASFYCCLVEEEPKEEEVNVSFNLSKRYQLKIGKFGCYFYDAVNEKDLTLEEVANLLNKDN